MPSLDCNIRQGELADLAALIAIEEQSFNQDRLSSRSLKRWLSAPHGILLIAEQAQKVVGYGLVWCHKGTRLARLYSLAVHPSVQGQGVASQLLQALEHKTAQRGRLFMRLEVAVNNHGAIKLYEKLGYRVFGHYSDYYDDHSDALRMQKNIRQTSELTMLKSTPWYQQTTEFTCGPAALLMAMSSIGDNQPFSQLEELDIWREATTIFMTSGHGGCHPLGLALAAKKRGFYAEAIINTQQPLFIDGVRSEKKKLILDTVHQQFVQQSAEQRLLVQYQELDLSTIENWLAQGYAVVLLISTYRFDGKKSPHWVCVTHIDEHCLYVHDPFCENEKQLAIDCQHVPIAKSDFVNMASFGSSRLSTALAIRKDRH